ncbi:MAG TPA: LPS assembly lipoprotein LptE, partial [Thermodesulfovibrionales bacterium]|nr:LPS assembly lipoprotein LptE [Thermodesulfovibrionales bacterium]
GKKDLPFRTIAISKIVNKTFEPKLEDRMQTALVNELMVQGFEIESSSGYKINGAITQFELGTLSEKSGVATEYEVTIKGDFKLTDPSGKIKQLRNHGVFIVSFSSSEQLQTVMALKEQATVTALQDFASEIVASIMYQ